jgi:eukaryotic-like serine/threonine-protein kinase
MSLISFLKSKTLLHHILIALALAIVLLWVSLKMLDFYTRHNSYIEVPDVNGMEIRQAEQVLKRMDLRPVINDSIFDTNRAKGTIAGQNPIPGSEVKKNRTIYLTAVAILPEMVAMPDLTDLSFRQAQALLTAHGLQVGQLEYVANIARNAVLQQKYNNGTIQPGTSVEKGTAITLVLGTGEGSNFVNVPLVIGKTREEAALIINAASLNVGQEVYLDENTENVRVYKQSPNALTSTQQVGMGTTIDLYYRSADAFDFQEYTRETLGTTTPDLTGKTPWEVMEILDNAQLLLGEEYFEGNSTTQNARVYKQNPDATAQPSILKGSKVDVWYNRGQ